MSVTVHQELDVVAINQLLSGPSGGITRDMLRRGLRVQSHAKRLCPVDRGRLRGSIAIASVPRVVGGISTIGVVIGTNVDYARYVHEGTGVFGPRGTPITPHRGSFLVFKSRRVGRGFDRIRGKERLTFARSVRGQRGVPFLRNALQSAKG